jgi:hypothetical protein
MNNPTRPSGRPGRNHSSHSGRERFSRRCRSFLTRQQELRLIGRRIEREHSDVLGDIDGRSVGPQRPAQPKPWAVQQLPEARNKMEPSSDLIACRLDRESTIGVEEPPAVEDGERADVL